LDGTLIDTEARSMAMWQLLLDKYEVEYDVRGFIGRRGADVVAEVFPGADVDEVIREVFSYDDHPGLPEIAPVPGAAELVREVAAYGSPIGLVTSARRWWADAKLVEIGVRELIDTIVSAEDVTIGKPDPAGFLLAAERLGASPDDCVVFEDSLAGVAAARAAGMRCVGVTTSHAGEELADADLVVADLTAIGWPPFTQGSGWSGPGTEGEAHG
jgi:mannitol-1-/sugar-/sorbitol-6-phosphatase